MISGIPGTEPTTTSWSSIRPGGLAVTNEQAASTIKVDKDTPSHRSAVNASSTRSAHLSPTPEFEQRSPRSARWAATTIPPVRLSVEPLLDRPTAALNKARSRQGSDRLGCAVVACASRSRASIHPPLQPAPAASSAARQAAIQISEYFRRYQSAHRRSSDHQRPVTGARTSCCATHSAGSGEGPPLG